MEIPISTDRSWRAMKYLSTAHINVTAAHRVPASGYALKGNTDLVSSTGKHS